MAKSRCLAEWFSTVLLILCMNVALSAQSNGIDPALLAKAKAGDANSQFNIGMLYDNGQGVPKDHAEATRWFRKAAEQGNATAQYHLGLAFSNGEGVPQDYAQAAFWYRKAAIQGHARAQYEFALKLISGCGVPQNIKEAMIQFQKAAEQGDVESEYMLGSIYEEGGLGKVVPGPDGSYTDARVVDFYAVPKDLGLAAKWYRKGAEQGNAQAQNGLGRLYAEGKGVPQDYVEAYFWLSLASANGSHSSTNDVDDRDFAASHLTKAVLLETQERARKWFENHQSKPH